MKKILLFIILSVVTLYPQNIRIDQIRRLPDTLAYILLHASGNELGLAGMIRDSLNNRLGSNWVTPQIYGAVNDNSVDASTAINQALSQALLLEGTYGDDITLYVPNGIYRLDHPLILETTTGYRSVNIVGQSTLNTRFYYYGNTDSAAFWLQRPSRFQISNLSIYNQNTSGTATGIRIKGTADEGADAVIGLLESIAIQSFENGIYMGDSSDTVTPTNNAVEEMTYINLDVSYCVNGVRIEGDNSLNHSFINPNIVYCGTGIKTIEANSVNVFGGSFSHDTTTCMSFLWSGSFNVIGVRGETSPRFITIGYEDSVGGGTPTTANIMGNTFINDGTGDDEYDMTDSVAIRLGKAGLYTIQGNTLDGLIEIETNQPYYSTLTLRNNVVSQDTLYRIAPSTYYLLDNYYIRVISEGNTNTSASVYGTAYFPNETVFYNGAKTIESNEYLQNNGFFSHDPFGSNRLFNPQLENLLYSSVSRFAVVDTGFESITEYKLFDGQYGSYVVVDSSDTGKVYIDFTTKSEFGATGVTYTGGYVLLHFYYTNIPASIDGDFYSYTYSQWIPFESAENISTNGNYAVWKMTVPDSTYATDMRFYVVARDTMDAYLNEIEYYPLRQGSTEMLPLVTKAGANSLYGKTSWKNFNNTETAYIDSNGNASFLNMQFTGDLNLQTGRIDLPTYENMSLDSLVTRVAKNDTMTIPFGISDVADGSYSTAFKILSPITITRVDAVLRTSATSNDSAKCNVYFGSSIYSGASTIWTTDKVLSDTTTGESYTSFNDATIPAYSWIWLQCNDEVETVNQINVTVYARKD